MRGMDKERHDPPEKAQANAEANASEADQWPGAAETGPTGANPGRAEPGSADSGSADSESRPGPPPGVEVPPDRPLLRMTQFEAARRLGVTKNLIKKRVGRDAIPHERDPDGKVYVYVDPADLPDEAPEGTVPAGSDSADGGAGERGAGEQNTVERLLDRIEDLTRMLENEQRANAENRLIIGVLLNGVPGLRELPKTEDEARRIVESLGATDERVRPSLEAGPEARDASTEGASTEVANTAEVTPERESAPAQPGDEEPETRPETVAQEQALTGEEDRRELRATTWWRRLFGLGPPRS